MEDARANDKADAAQVELEKSSNAIVKGFAFITEEIQVDVVKALMVQEDGGVSIVKALGLAQEAIDKAVADLATVEAEKEAIKKEFGEVENAEKAGETVIKSTADSLA